MLLYLRSKKTASRTFVAIFWVGQHAGMSDICFQNTVVLVGQHAGTRNIKLVKYESAAGSACAVHHLKVFEGFKYESRVATSLVAWTGSSAFPKPMYKLIAIGLGVD
jgi:hypothetical protein